MLARLLSAITLGATESESYRLSDPRVSRILGWGDGGASGSGAKVNRDSALTCSPWFRGLDLLSDSVGKAPVSIFRRLEPSGKEEDRQHEWYRALSRKPAKWITTFSFFKLMTLWMRGDGNAYAWIDRDEIELEPMSPATTTPVMETDGNGVSRLWYVGEGSHGQQQKYHPDEILHFKGLGFDGLVGQSVMDMAREALGLSLGARNHQTASLKNSARPSVILTFPGKMQKAARDKIIEEWERMYSGSKNSHRTAVLDSGMSIKELGFDAVEMELMATQEFSIRDIANFIGVPPHKLGDVSRQGYNSLEQENLSFLSDTLEAILVNIEQELEDKLLTEREKSEGSHEILFNRRKLVSADLAAKSAYWRTALGGNPWAKVSEARQDFDMNHEDETDFIPQPANMSGPGGPGGEQNRPKDPTGNFPKGEDVKKKIGDDDDTGDAIRRATAAALKSGKCRVVRRLCNQARAKSGKPAEFIAWVDDLVATNIVAAKDELADLEEAASLASGYATSIGSAIRLVEDMERRFKAVVETATAKDLAETVASTAAEIEAEYKGA